MKYKVVPIIKLVCIVYLAIFVPRFVWFKSTNKPIPKKEPPVTMIGIQNLTSNKTDNFNWIKKLRLALVSDKISNKNNLIKNGFKVQKLFLVNKKNKTLQDLTPESLANTDA
ncbi:MAG: hypothetical protein P9X22_07560, partial [Candidatus Zapsychrus exili]|nr:hypothetical protein [Candidatus Zapsychrus exili]